MKKKYYCFGAVCMSVALILSGCHSEEGKGGSVGNQEPESGVQLKIAFWGSSGEEQALKEAAVGLEKTVNGVSSVVWEQFPSVNEFYDTLPTQAVIGKMPDIVMLSNEEQKALIEAGILEPIEEIPDSNLYIENISAEWMYQGKLYGLPSTAAPALFIINDDMWKKAGLLNYPETWEEVYEDAKVLKAHGFMPLCIEIGNLYHITQYLLSFGGGWDEGVNMNTEGNREALSYILKMFDEGLAVTEQDEGKSWSGEVFLDKKCAMVTGGTWYIGNLKEAPDIHYRILPVPGTDRGNEKTIHSYGFSVMNGSQNKEAAQEAVKYMTRKEAQEIRMRITGDCPSLVSLQDAYYDLYPQISFMCEDIKLTRSFEYPTDLTVLDRVREKLEQRIYGGNRDLSPDEILTLD